MRESKVESWEDSSPLLSMSRDTCNATHACDLLEITIAIVYFQIRRCEWIAALHISSITIAILKIPRADFDGASLCSYYDSAHKRFVRVQRTFAVPNFNLYPGDKIGPIRFIELTIHTSRLFLNA